MHRLRAVQDDQFWFPHTQKGVSIAIDNAHEESFDESSESRLNSPTGSAIAAPDLQPVVQIASFIREHALWALGLSPFVIATINIVVLSGGKPQVFGYLVKGLDIVGLILSASMPLVPVIFLWGALVWLSTDSNWLLKRRTDIGAMFYLIGLFGLILSAFTVQLSYLAIMAFSFGIHGCRYTRVVIQNRRDTKRYGDGLPLLPPPRYGYVQLIASLGLICFLSIISSAPTWLPTENIKVRQVAPFSGQTIASDGDWTMVFRSSGNVQIVRTADIESRIPCEDSQMIFSRTIAEMVARSGNRMEIAACLPG